MAKRSGMYKMEKRKKELKRKKKKEEKMLNRLKANQESTPRISNSLNNQWMLGIHRWMIVKIMTMNRSTSWS